MQTYIKKNKATYFPYSLQENNERNAALVKAMNLNAYSYCCDCSSEEQVKEVAAKVEEEIGPVDILVNNAGVLNGNSVTMLTQSQIRKTFDVNVLAQFWVRMFFSRFGILTRVLSRFYYF